MDATATSPSPVSPRAGLTAFPLKVLAIVGMTANHASSVYLPYLPHEWVCVLYALGGLTFPIMAFLLVEGYRHTSNIRRYAARLFVFALVAQLPYGAFLAHNANVMFTLLAGLAVMWLYDHVDQGRFWLAFAAIAAASAACDWGVLGPTMVLILHTVRGRRRIVYAAGVPILAVGLPALAQLAAAPSLINLAAVLYPLVGCSATIPLLLAYNGGRGRPMKWFFYAYYPAHIAVLGLAKGLLLGDWTLGE